jgi:hypothetical protein
LKDRSDASPAREIHATLGSQEYLTFMSSCSRYNQGRFSTLIVSRKNICCQCKEMPNSGGLEKTTTYYSDCYRPMVVVSVYKYLKAKRRMPSKIIKWLLN